jgi:predicted thioesterase
MGEAVLELIMSQLSTTEYRTDLDVVAVVAIELHYMATPTMVGVGQAMPNNTKIILQKTLESGMREVKSGHRRHRRKR